MITQQPRGHAAAARLPPPTRGYYVRGAARGARGGRGCSWPCSCSPPAARSGSRTGRSRTSSTRTRPSRCRTWSGSRRSSPCSKIARGRADRRRRDRRAPIKRVDPTARARESSSGRIRSPATRSPKGKLVTLQVSTGAPTVSVPDVRGKTVDDATEQLATKNLRPTCTRCPRRNRRTRSSHRIRRRASDVAAGSTVRINISQGPEQVGVPERGRPDRTTRRTQALQSGGIRRRRARPSTSNEPKDTSCSRTRQAELGHAQGRPGDDQRLEGPDGDAGPGRRRASTSRRRRPAAGGRLQGRSPATATRPIRRRTASCSSSAPLPARRLKPGATVTITVGRFVRRRARLRRRRARRRPPHAVSRAHPRRRPDRAAARASTTSPSRRRAP